ncbi:hypothetical protein [Tuwongella immobilis]|uniref:hypothetical protein n=1 Tax=Tuwongella immobilis TaxID=692036 RepID=UPI001E36BCD7|nr:hypothetical protein [Tuwongella immobilis]
MARSHSPFDPLRQPLFDGESFFEDDQIYRSKFLFELFPDGIQPNRCFSWQRLTA